MAGREIFSPVEYFSGRVFCLAGREFFALVETFFCRWRIFWPVESVFSGREVFWSVDREKSEKLDEKFLWAARFSRQNVVHVKVRRIAFVSFGMKWENELF